MQVIQSFDPSVKSGNIQVGSEDPGTKLLLYNLSLTTIQLNFNNGSTDLLHAGEARFWSLDGNTPQIEWSAYNTLPGTPNSSIITGTLYGANEALPGTYPVALTSNTYSNGGNVTTTSTTQVIDRNNIAGSLTLAAGPTGEPDTIQIYNDGTINEGNSTRQGIHTMALGQILRFVLHNNPGVMNMNLFGDSASGELRLTGPLNQKIFRLFSNQSPSTDIVFDFGNGNIGINQPGVQLAGATNGTATIYQDCTGTLKRCIVWFNAFRNGGATSQNLSIPVPFTTFARFTSTDIPGLHFNKVGVAQNLAIVSTANGTPQAATTNLNAGWFYGDILGGFDTINLHASGGVNHTGTLELIGV